MNGLGVAWKLAILLVATVGPPGANSDGRVGCLFSESLCVDEEWCYDDHAFGRCLPAFGSVVDEDLFQYELDRETLHTFEREMRRLFALGYRWSHAYTQCELQAMLYSARQGIEFDNTVCSHYVDQDLEGALKSLETEDSIDPSSTAYVRYTPSADNPNAEFADEVYFPVLGNIDSNADMMHMNNHVEDDDFVDPMERIIYPELMKRTWIPAMHRRSVPSQYPSMDNFIEKNDLINYLPQNDRYVDETNTETTDNLADILPFIEYLSNLKITADDIDYLLLPENSDKLQKLIEDFFDYYEKEKRQEEEFRREMLREWIREEKLAYVKEKLLEDMATQNLLTTTRFTRKYNTPEKFRLGWEIKDQYPSILDNTDASDLFESRVYTDENDPETFHEESGSGEDMHPQQEIFRELKNQEKYGNDIPEDGTVFSEQIHKTTSSKKKMPTQAGIFTEGGIVFVPDSQIVGETKADPEQILNNDLGKFLDEYDWGFKRRERLDVKKPGPPFDEHTHVSTEATAQKDTSATDSAKKILNYVPVVVKKDPRHPDPLREHFDVETDFVYIGLKDSIRTWKEGDNIVKNISIMLNLGAGTLSHIRVDRNEVTFRVGPNKFGYNATDLVKKIERIKDRLKNEMGIEITSAGVGDKTKMPAMLSVENIHSNTQMYIMIIILCGILGTIFLAVLVLFVIRSQILSRKKLHNLSHPDTEASKDYQDLCRARMATKGQQQASDKPEGVHGRITSLSRESEGSQHSPSSRSSTSSWSEEPSLTNMDISTGHMVLTYMEDHLKNKDRLEQEWVALCAYEAEPCSTAVALKPENVKKNRYIEVLPYDHARVVLNDLANISSSDYINASSITDHDPRNPAYIATQGPLPHTAPDFWQMVWEQGSVVMVMLTRLTENGNAMCHRYWPEEGSEVYHIYEVHLVSEHIWCDDYLVRSFYLKNVKTGETRTVTQFHFLSWPDHGIPTSTKALLEFRRKVNKSYRGRSCPIVVHCSDGAGRTGTYCLIDMVLNRMAKGAKEIDIAATLEHIRDQRPAMVATKQQFEFVLMAVAEEVHAILKALPAQLQQLEKKEVEKEKDKQ